MAKKPTGPNKSDEIRAILTANPNTTVKEVMATLAQRGIKVTDTLVYGVKAKMKHKKRRQQRQQVATAMPNGSAGAVALIVKVKGIAAEVGGWKKLKELVDVLSQ